MEDSFLMIQQLTENRNLPLYKKAKGKMIAGGPFLRKWKKENAELVRENKQIENVKMGERESYPDLDMLYAKETSGKRIGDKLLELRSYRPRI